MLPQVVALIAVFQPVPQVELTKPAATSPDPFTQIMAVRELSDGRVLVVDFQEKSVVLLDRALQRSRDVGRLGKGPGEYTMPLALVPMPRDLTYLLDPMNQRLLAINPDGSTGESLAFASMAKGMVMMVSPTADSKGRIYYQGMAADLAAINADSAAVLRLDVTAKRLDTMGYFRPQKMNISTAAGKVRLGAMKMFAAEEAWTATSDGKVARVIPNPYHLVLYAGTEKPVVGPNIPYQPIQVTDDEKAEAKRAWEKGMAAGKAAAAAAGGRQAAQMFSAAEPEFESQKPPFPGRAAALAGPNGEVWVERSRPFADKAGLYDRFDRAGNRIGQIRLGARSRIVGVGKQTVYVVRSDEDDLTYLERHAWPAK